MIEVAAVLASMSLWLVGAVAIVVFGVVISEVRIGRSHRNYF